MSTESKILDLDLNTMKKDEVNFASSYYLRMKRTDHIHGLVAWFDCIFHDPKRPEKRAVLSTHPGVKTTHWKQTTFYLDLKKDLSLPVKKDDILSGSLACKQGVKNFRELDVKISYHLHRPSKNGEGKDE